MSDLSCQQLINSVKKLQYFEAQFRVCFQNKDIAALQNLQLEAQKIFDKVIITSIEVGGKKFKVERLVVGGISSRQEIIDYMLQHDTGCGLGAKHLILKNEYFVPIPKGRHMNFVAVEVGDLGFENNTPRAEVLQQAVKPGSGLALCPTGAAPYISMHQAYQFPSGTCSIATPQIIDGVGQEHKFYLSLASIGRHYLESCSIPRNSITKKDNKYIFWVI